MLFTAMAVTWAVGLGLTLFLWWSTRGDGLPPGCGVDKGCGIVLSSEFSRVLGVSLTLWSLGYFVVAGLFLCMARFSFQSSLAPPVSMLLTVVTSLGVAAGLWSMIVMGAFLKEFCYYCVALHLCNFVFFGLSLTYATQDWRHRQYRRWKANVPPLPKAPVTIHSVLALLLITSQVVVMSLFHSDPPATLVALEMTSVLDVKNINNVLEKLGVDVAPPGGTAIETFKGDKDAPNRIVTYSCLTCPHCKRANAVLNAMMARYPGKLRVDVRFFPLGKCNDVMKNREVSEKHKHACPLARDAWAVAAVDSSKFSGFVNWLYDNQKGMTPEKSAAHVKTIVDAAKYEAALSSNDVALREQQDLRLAGNFGLTGVPHIFMVGGQVYGGMSFGSLEKLFSDQFGWTLSTAAIESIPGDDELVLLSGQTVNRIATKGQLAEQDGDFQAAAKHYRRVLELQPDSYGVLLTFAELLATCGDDEVFNPEEAEQVFAPAQGIIAKREELLEKLPKKTKEEREFRDKRAKQMKEVWAKYYEVAAAVHAAHDRFSEAREEIMRAVRHHRITGNKKTVAKLEDRFNKFYSRNLVYRQPTEATLRYRPPSDGDKPN